MASDEGHIHWSGLGSETVNYLGQELQLTSERSNAATIKSDPIGMVRIRLDGHAEAGAALPSDGWQPVPGTAPTLEARADAHYPIGYIRIRQA